MTLKVRINETKKPNTYVAWIDAQTQYYYGRSFVDSMNITPEMIETESAIETFLKQQGADFTKRHVSGCLPEWDITFRENKDITSFLLTWVDNT